MLQTGPISLSILQSVKETAKIKAVSDGKGKAIAQVTLRPASDENFEQWKEAFKPKEAEAEIVDKLYLSISDGLRGEVEFLKGNEFELNDIACFCNRDLTADEVKNILGVNNLFSANNCLLPSNEKTYEKLTLELNKTMKAYNINSCLRKAHFLAQCAHESDNFKTTSEYNGSKKGYAPYFGRGLIQLTHKGNYQKYANYKNQTLESIKEKISNNLEYSLDVSGWYWKTFSAWGDLNLYADNDDCLRVSLGINGGVNGYNDRKSKTKKMIKVMNITKCKKVNDSKELGKYTYQTSSAKEKSWARENKKLLEKYDD